MAKKVKFKVIGRNLHNFVNALYNRNLVLYNLSMQECELTCSVDLETFDYIQKLYGNSNYKIVVLSQPKYRSYKNFLKYNFAILLALLLSTAALCAYSCRIWQYKVYGLTNVSLATIEQTLENAGVKKGVLKSSVDLKNIANVLVQNIDGVALASVNFVGTTLAITISEKIDNSALLSTAAPVVAPNDCVITKIVTTSGTALVGIGDKVAKGQTLIANYVENSLGARIPSRASGEIWANVYYSHTKVFGATNYELRRSGRTQKIVSIGNEEARAACKFAQYETQTRSYYLSKTLPIKVTETTYYELEKVEVRVDLDKEENLLIEKTKAETRERFSIDDFDEELVSVAALDGGKKQITVTYIKEENILNI